MIETYKILKRHYDLDPSTFFTLNTATTRGHSLKLLKERSRLLVSIGGGKGGARGLKPPLGLLRGGLAPPQNDITPKLSFLEWG